jgi:LPXTG-motif cell wall-anchored protein
MHERLSDGGRWLEIGACRTGRAGLTAQETTQVGSLTKQAIGFGIAIGLIFGVPTMNVGVGIGFGLMFGVGFYVFRKRKRLS